MSSMLKVFLLGMIFLSFGLGLAFGAIMMLKPINIESSSIKATIIGIVQTQSDVITISFDNGRVIDFGEKYLQVFEWYDRKIVYLEYSGNLFGVNKIISIQEGSD